VAMMSDAKGAKDPPRGAAPVQSVRALVEQVPAPLVGSGPSSFPVRLEDNHLFPGAGSRRCRGEAGQAGSDDHHSIVLRCSHATMTSRTPHP
jgi:hypothetical protein